MNDKCPHCRAEAHNVENTSLTSSGPRRFYWKQSYELDDAVHWALHDTQTDSEAPPNRATCGAMVLVWNRPKYFGRPLNEEFFPKLIVELLNAHFAKSADEITNERIAHAETKVERDFANVAAEMLSKRVDELTSELTREREKWEKLKRWAESGINRFDNRTVLDEMNRLDSEAKEGQR